MHLGCVLTHHFAFSCTVKDHGKGDEFEVKGSGSLAPIGAVEVSGKLKYAGGRISGNLVLKTASTFIAHVFCLLSAF